eukprot:117148_1
MLSLKSVRASMKIDVSDNDIVRSSLSALTPHSPVTPPITAKCQSNGLQSSTPKPYSLYNAFTQRGYMPLKRIGNTLQGSIWIATKTDDKETSVTSIIKVADKSLHNQQIANINGVSIHVSESIVREAAILKSLNSNGARIGLIQFDDFFVDSRNLFLVMENGGSSMFQFVMRCHELIKNRILDIQEWHVFCKRAMYQMVDVCEWMHDSMDCCHLDLSLENFTIKDVQLNIMMSETGNKIRFASDVQMKVVDFGLAEVFPKGADGKTDFKCTKYVGKTQYKAPEVNAKIPFDARKADCWSLAVCFFMIFLGIAPFNKACDEDVLFMLIMNGRLQYVLENWKVLDYVSAPIVDLLCRMFRAEEYRLTMRQIKHHIWFTS